jgi:DNA-binding transcriptional LysR family regulator
MKSLRGIASFVDVANTGSFTAAAKLQGVSSVAVGKSVATLERQMGVRLIQRTTRKLSLTIEGQSFLKQVLGPLRDIEAAQSNVQASTKSLSGVVRITSVPPIARGYLMPIIAKFHVINPKVQIELYLLLFDAIESKLTLYLHFPSRKNLPARTRALIDFIVDQLQAEPDLQTPSAQLLMPFTQ